jgi:REP element-mobilizing transposase RayT
MRRQQIEGAATWHVLSRAARRLDLFRDAVDYRAFLERLESACEKSGVAALAYALMPNHYHLLASGSTQGLAAAMHRLNRSYARAFNTRHDQRGHVFEGTYRALVLAPEWRVAHASRYLHLNPVASKLVKKPGDWRWSSYTAYVMGRSDVRGLRTAGILKMVGGKAGYVKDMPRAMDAMPRKNATNSPEGLWESEARWIRAHVADHPPAGIDANALGLYIASEAGVPPRVGAVVFGFSSPLYAGIVVSRWEDRLDRDAKFAAAVKAWRTEAGL